MLTNSLLWNHSSYSVDEGYRYGKLAMKLYEKFRNEAWLSRVWSFYYGAVASWKEPLSSTLEPLQHGFKVGLRTGKFGKPLFRLYLLAGF